MTIRDLQQALERVGIRDLRLTYQDDYWTAWHGDRSVASRRLDEALCGLLALRGGGPGLRDRREIVL